MRKQRVLIDTNILLSGLIWSGNESHLLEMAESGEIHLLIPEFVIQEARRVMQNKFPKHVNVLDEVLAVLNCEILKSPSKDSVATALSLLRDPNDAQALASVIDSQPDYAVTGDKDLLTDEVQSIFPTIKCIDFLRKITGSDQS